MKPSTVSVRELLSRLVAIAGLGLTLLALLLYAGSGGTLFFWLAAASAMVTLVAAIWYFLERGKRFLALEEAFAYSALEREKNDDWYEVQVLQEGEIAPARIRREAGAWRLELAGSLSVMHEAERGDGRIVWADYELDHFARKLQREQSLVLRCCGTCAHFAHSQISRRVSDGWVGYCTLRSSGPVLPEKDTTHLWGLCPDWQERAP